MATHTVLVATWDDGVTAFADAKSSHELAGKAVRGLVVGPPLGIRSITATCDGGALLANVHVGGIPRSIDGGATWHPTINLAEDVHEVRAHHTRSLSVT